MCRLPDSMLKQQAKALMRAMAIEVDDESVEVRSLMAMSKDEKGVETREVARKVFVDRRISGIPVHGNRLVFTFQTMASSEMFGANGMTIMPMSASHM